MDWNENEKWVSVRDNGIGMTREELIQNLGTIAKSGTTQFMDALKTGDVSLIGQFGVGFYSSFLVGSRVLVRSKPRNGPQHIWESSSASQFSVRQDPEGDSLGQGTEVKIFLKEDAYEFANEKTLNKYIKKFSSFINFPIYLHKVETVEEKVDKSEAEFNEEVANKTEARRLELLKDNVTLTEEEEEKIYSEVSKTKTETVTRPKWERVNSEKVLWMRDKSELTPSDYENFYKTVFYGISPLATYSHFRAEGDVEFTSLLFIQERAAFDIFDKFNEKKNQLKLYVRRVLINDQFEDLLPKWLNFVEGIVDSDSLSIGVSRENLQHSKQLKQIGKKLMKKVIEMLSSFDPRAELEDDQVINDVDREDRLNRAASDLELRMEKFNKFEENYGKHLRLGILEDSAYREELAHLCRWYSTVNMTKKTGLDEYIDRMKPSQDFIYYLGGEDRHVLLHSPLI